MSTTFPSSKQTFAATRGTAGQKLNSPNHITHHTNEDDTVEALQDKVGTGSSTPTSTKLLRGTGVGASAWDKTAPTGEIVGDTDSQTLTSKTLTSPVITNSSSSGTDSGTETLVNKTLTSPAVNTPTITTPTVRNFDGWQDANESWTYASASTITVPSGAASKYAVGDRIKWTQTTVKYGVIVSVADTLLTIAVNTDYVVTNAAISANFYSHEATPIGYPQWFVYTPVWTGTNHNGTLIGKFSILGTTCTVNVDFIMGSTSTFAVGANTLTVPRISQNTLTRRWVGVCRVLDAGTADWLMNGFINNNDTVINFTGNNTAGGWSSTQLFAWAVSDELHITLTYEI